MPKSSFESGSPEAVQEAVTPQPAKSGGGTFALIIAVIAFVAALAGVALAFTNQPDLTGLESRIKALEENATMEAEQMESDKMEAEEAMEQKIGEIVDEKLMEKDAMMEEDGAMMEEDGAMMEDGHGDDAMMEEDGAMEQ